MDRKRGISGRILKAFALIAISGCHDIETMSEMEIAIMEPECMTRALMPAEEQVSDMNLLIFDSRGNLEYSVFTSSSTCRVDLLKGERYTFCACLNFGYRITARTMKEFQETRYHLAYPDEYRDGIPMCAMLEDHLITEDGTILLAPERLMAKISLRLDRSRLSENVKMEVSGVRIGNCPRNVQVYGCSRAESEDDCFSLGFSLGAGECSALNRENAVRLSESVSVYMLENMQGLFDRNGISEDEEKVFEEYDGRNRTCSYIEIEMDYISDKWESGSNPLIYRFYLGEDRNSLDIKRNCHYRITVCPEDDGLGSDGWRVDKSGLRYIGETSLVQYPGGYIAGDIGDRIHIGCILTPGNVMFDVGEEYMRADKAEGIYDYEIDEDGHGATLTLTGPGRGLIYMEAGEPVNDAALFVIEVNRPVLLSDRDQPDI